MSDYLVPMLVVACFYLAIVYLITLAILIVEKRLSKQCKDGSGKTAKQSANGKDGCRI